MNINNSIMKEKTTATTSTTRIEHTTNDHITNYHSINNFI
uniref:Uncharacterized protein n=1 Tax=Schistosoma japonicum TaxID=6182 RepID=Q5C1S2_SCHJA|nr:unknown [Schistosoma japonicum]